MNINSVVVCLDCATIRWYFQCCNRKGTPAIPRSVCELSSADVKPQYVRFAPLLSMVMVRVIDMYGLVIYKVVCIHFGIFRVVNTYAEPKAFEQLLWCERFTSLFGAWVDICTWFKWDGGQSDCIAHMLHIVPISIARQRLS